MKDIRDKNLINEENKEIYNKNMEDFKNRFRKIKLRYINIEKDFEENKIGKTYVKNKSNDKDELNNQNNIRFYLMIILILFILFLIGNILKKKFKTI